ncbi:MAG TPA: chemotaxis protein CheW [Xenococcaceae cyanobacterium]
MSRFITKSDFITLSTANTNYQEKAQQFLKFHLEPETKAILPLIEVTEVLKIPLGKIVPIPQMLPWVMGVYNWRGEILWTVDLGHLIGLYTWYQQNKQNTNYSIIVISNDKKSQGSSSSLVGETGEPRQKPGFSTNSLGLIVTQVEDIELCNPDLIQSPPATAVTNELAPFLQGYFLKPDGQMLLALNSNALIAAMPKN